MAERFISVIMPVRNEEDFIARSLGAVLAQAYPPEAMEILVVDGDSTDATREVIRSLPGAERVRIVPNPARNQAAGMNAALRVARGEIIVRVDGHTIIAPDYVRQCVATLDETGADNVGGCMTPVGVTPTGKAIAAAARSRFAVPSAFHVSATPQYTDTVYLGAWPRGVLERVGGYDERLSPNEDYDLNHRIRRSGGRIYLSPAIRSDYYGRQDYRALARQYYFYGEAKVASLRKHPESLRPRQLVAPAFVAALVAGAALAPFYSAVLLAWLAVIVAYGAANLAASVAASRERGGTRVWRVALAFLTIHLAWGTGFWDGVFRGAPGASRAVTRAALAPRDTEAVQVDRVR